ncbi:protein BTG1-like [Rhinophrynus dorsalis]
MKTEISTAAAFVTSLLKTSGTVEESQLQQFCQSLQESMKDHYKHHWFPQTPCKGSGYRCLRINHKMDPLIGQAAGHIGLSHQRLFQLLPSELTLWVDPFEVSYRIGEDGSICVLYEGSTAVCSCQGHHSSCKDSLRIGQNSPSKNYTMMTVSS